MKNILLLLAFISPSLLAGDIGFGKIDAIKQYDFNDTKLVKIYLNPSSIYKKNQCLENERQMGTITLSMHDAAQINRMVSLATAAYMADKKVRLYSGSNSCEIDFISLQEVYF